jgi:hypothetical protein
MAGHFTVPGLFPPPGYAHVAVVELGERLVFTAGVVPLDANGLSSARATSLPRPCRC